MAWWKVLLAAGVGAGAGIAAVRLLKPAATTMDYGMIAGVCAAASAVLKAIGT